MPQLHFSVDEATAKELSRRAKAKGMSLSGYLAELMKPRIKGSWPKGYLDGVIGACADDPLTEPPDLELDPVNL